MPADASNRITRRSFLGIAEEPTGHISSLVVRAHPDRLAAVVRRIAAPERRRGRDERPLGQDRRHPRDP